MVARVVRGALAFAVLGLIWAAELGLLLRVGCFEHDDALSFFSLPVLVPCASAFVGAVVAAVAAQPPRLDRSLAVVVLVPLVAMVTGIVAALLWWPVAVGLGAANGLAFGVAALPLIWPLFRAMRARSRPSSMTDIAERYSTYAVLGAVGAVTSVLTLARWRSYPMCESETTQATFAMLASVAIATSAAAALVAHARRARRAIASPPWFLDLGVGDARHELCTHPPTAYRHASETVSTVYGDAALATRIIDARTRAGVVSAVTAIVAGAATLVLQAQ